MKCFYNRDADAVGVCKNCFRAVCPGCLVEVDNGLACKNRCELTVRQLNTVMMKSIAAIDVSPMTSKRIGLTGCLAGVAMIVFGTLTIRSGGIAPLMFGLFLLAIGVTMYRGASRIKAVSEQAH